MERAEKKELVATLNQVFKTTGVIVVAHNKGLTVNQVNDLRNKMAQAGATVKVAKNRLACRALAGTPYEGLTDLFRGPTAIAYATDPVATAKVAVTYAKTNPKLILLGGGLGRQMLDAEGVRALAALPSLDELRGTLLGLLNAPASRIASVLQAPGGQLARVLAAYAEANDQTGEAA